MAYKFDATLSISAEIRIENGGKMRGFVTSAMFLLLHDYLPGGVPTASSLSSGGVGWDGVQRSCI